MSAANAAMTSDFSFMFDVWWRWLSWRSGEDSRGAVPAKRWLFGASAFDQRDERVSDLAQERGARFGTGERGPAGNAIGTRVRDHVREDISFGAIGIIGGR